MVKRGRLPRSTMNQSGWMIRDDFTLADRLQRPASKRTLSARADNPTQAAPTQAAPTQPQVATPISIHVAGVRVTLTTHTPGHFTIDIDQGVFGSGSKGV